MLRVNKYVCKQCIARTCTFQSEDSIGTPPRPIKCPLGIINEELKYKSKWNEVP